MVVSCTPYHTCTLERHVLKQNVASATSRRHNLVDRSSTQYIHEYIYRTSYTHIHTYTLYPRAGLQGKNGFETQNIHKTSPKHSRAPTAWTSTASPGPPSTCSRAKTTNPLRLSPKSTPPQTLTRLYPHPGVSVSRPLTPLKGVTGYKSHVHPRTLNCGIQLDRTYTPSSPRSRQSPRGVAERWTVSTRRLE